MYIVQLRFELGQTPTSDYDYSPIYDLLSALRMNGQILGTEWCGTLEESCYTFLIPAPEAISLDDSFSNIYIKKNLQTLIDKGITITKTILGTEPDAAPSCTCRNSSSYILYTFWGSIEPQIRCGDCFGTIPLYRLHPTIDNEYHDIIAWNSNYQACDTLQMNCTVGERFAINQLRRHDSALSKSGIEICSRIEAVTGVPTYYYLFHYYGRSLKMERSRKCPSCGQDWLLEKELHKLFNFKCDKCRLLSNIAMEVNL